jgi:RNA polymerase sigma-70 factor (ECF subfamily)
MEAEARGPIDSSEFAELYREHVGPVFRYCFFRLETREQAEDATSQIFLKALAALPAHRQRDSFRSWLFSIAHNVITDIYRARRPTSSLADGEDLADDHFSLEDEALQSVEKDEVRALLGQLPMDQRRVLELRLAGLTSSEIATVLGKKTGAVKVAQSRAIARLRLALTPDPDVHPNQENVHDAKP